MGSQNRAAEPAIANGPTACLTIHGAGTIGSGDEAGGSPPLELPAPATAAGAATTLAGRRRVDVTPLDPEEGRRPASLPIANPACSSFAAHEARLQQLLAEPCEALTLKGSTSDCWGTPLSRSRSSRESLGFAGDIEHPYMDPLATLVRNLDTGEVRDLLCEAPGESFFGRWEDPRGMAWNRGQSSTAWAGWWQEHRQRHEQLRASAETGNADALRALLGVRQQSRLDAATAHGSDSSRGGSSRMCHMLRQASPASAAPATAGVAESRMPAVPMEARTPDGRTVLHIAASRGHAECVQVLLLAGADVSAITRAGFNALHFACQQGHLDVVCILHAVGCEMSTQTDEGDLPLHLAAARGHHRVVRFLLQVGSSSVLGVRNSRGQKPAQVCIDFATAELFLDTGSCSGQWSRSSCGSLTCGRHEIVDDSYAGRVLFRQGGVLLRNSRSDVVRRFLLHGRAEAGPQPPNVSAPGTAGKGPGSAGVCDADLGAGGVMAGASLRGERSCGRGRRHPSFSRLHAEGGIEVVGPRSFKLCSVLGRGSFGEVYQVVHKKTGQVYAMKVLKKSKIISRNLVRYAMTERNLLSYIRHPFIVRLHYAFQTPSCLVLVLQFCGGGSLAQLILLEGSLPEALARLYIAEVFLAIEHLHERHVVYRDLKPDNIVLDDDGHAMLTDFGLSKEGVDGLRGTGSFCGSVAYLAPEILARQGHGRLVDMYGLGVVLYEILAAHPPFYSRNRETLFRNIATAALHAPPRASPRAAQLIHALMQRDPAQRLGARKTSEVRSHPFFSCLDWARVLRREVPVPPLRRGSRLSSADGDGDTKVASPFEGRLEAQVRRSLSSGSRDVEGWEFATPGPPAGSPPASLVCSPMPPHQASAASGRRAAGAGARIGAEAPAWRWTQCITSRGRRRCCSPPPAMPKAQSAGRHCPDSSPRAARSRAWHCF
mmetsp:Transcript_113450/g.315916  ORF Transcript_113450/g.315916 Transcript_113450/m.315916 type:complete len:941 (-) Transcript_113450:23-2845(-)